jgi:hypothetical protein
MIASFISRFRALIAVLSIAFSLAVFILASFYYRPYPAGLRLVDISFWILFLGSVAAGLLDTSLFWRKSPLFSTILFTILGTGLVIIARVSSAIYSLLKTSFYTQLIGGSIIDEASYKLASMGILGSFMVAASTAMSTVQGEPVVFRESPTLHSLLTYAVKALSNIGPRTLYIISFIIGFAVRLYPELKYPDLPISWDTLEYISVARDFAEKPKILTTYLWLGGWRNLPPLLTWIPGLLALAGIDSWMFFKIYPPISIGIMSMITMAIAYRLSNSKWIALASSLLMVCNPYILGQSQQWHRHVLGVIMLLAYLYLCERRARPIHRASILIIAALSYEPAAVIALLLSIAEAVMSRDRGSRGIFALSTAISLVALLWYTGFPQRPIMALTSSGVYVAGNIEYRPESALSYTITCMLLLTPSLAIIPIWRHIDWRARLSIIMLLTAFLLPILSIIAPVDQHRWFTMLLTIITPYMAVGLATLNKRILTLIVICVLILGSAYPFTEQGFTHFRIWPKASIAPAEGYPWKMEPAIANITDIENAAEIIRTSGDVALVGLRLYPQLHLYIRNPVNIIALNQDPTLPTTIRYMNSKNLTRVLAITTINMSKQLEEFKENPDIYNATIFPQLGKEKIVSIDRIRCETIYGGDTLNIYLIEITRDES